MTEVNLVLSIPQGSITATSLGVEGLARHRSPGSGKHFKGRKLFVDLKVDGLKPGFSFLEEGGWRDQLQDTEAAMAAAARGNRTKTALSNNAFSCTPVEAYRTVYLAKTGGHVLEMEQKEHLHTFAKGECHEEMSPSEVAEAAGSRKDVEIRPRFYMVMCPIELLLVSNLTPIEYAWYATHRPGKIFRQVVFTELHSEQTHLAAQSRYTDALREIAEDPEKKTKTVVSDDCMNEIPFHSWVGFRRNNPGGVYVADNRHIDLWKFPERISHNWDRLRG